MIDFSQLTESDLAALKARLDQLTDVSGRTRVQPGRQLHDLRLLPTATDPRPLFIPSAEAPRNAPPERPPFAQLLWHKETNREIVCRSEAEVKRKLEEGYQLTPAESRALNPEELLALEFAQLSPEDQQLAIDMAAKAKRDALQAKLSELSDEQLQRMVAAAGGVKPSRKRA